MMCRHDAEKNSAKQISGRPIRLLIARVRELEKLIADAPEGTVEWKDAVRILRSVRE